MTEDVSKVKPPNRIAGDAGFKDKTVLITGATGFLGKVLVEKILRTCPLVEKIYAIVRTKRGKDPQSRVKEMFTNPLFDLLKKTRGEKILQKVVAIPGEVSEPDLGLSVEDRKLLAEEVEIIFHLAATVRFEDSFKKTVLLNSRGTKLMLELAKECKKLLVFSHISTVYCYPHEEVLYEKTYAPPTDPAKAVRIAELLDEDDLELLCDRLRGGWPNTYSYSKALAEGFVNEEMDNLPVIILRPSIVVPIWKEPLPGWANSLIGPMGILVAAAKGILRSMHCNSSTYADLIPVDIVVNAMILNTYDYMVYNIPNIMFLVPPRARRVGNLASSSIVKYTWNEIIEVGKKLATGAMPLNWVVWYPGGSPKSSKFVHNVCAVLFHYIPAIFLDSLIVFSGNKPVLWRIQRRIARGSELLEYYANNQWVFDISGALERMSLINETEKEIYKVDEEGWNVEEYFCEAMHATRLYLLKESDESLPTAKRHIKVMWAVDKLCKILMLIGLGYLLLKYFVYPALNVIF